MVEFYSNIFQVSANQIVPGRLELPNEDINLVFITTSEKVTVATGSCGLEFLRDDVDMEYSRLISLGIDIPEPPVIYP